MIPGLTKKLIQDRNLLNLVKCGEPKFTDTFYCYTSGEIGPYFFQSIAITGNGRFYQQAIDDLMFLIDFEIGSEQFDVISGGETRDWDFSNPVAVQRGLAHAKLYKDRTALGASVKWKRVLHIADLNNEGSSVQHYWKPQIEQLGGKIVHVLFYVDRMEEGVKVMSDLGLPRHAVVQLDKDAWQTLLDKNVLTKERYTSLNDRLENKQSWAESTLRQHVDHIITLHQDKENKKKIQNVLNKGYPHLKDELVDRMKQLGYSYQE